MFFSCSKSKEREFAIEVTPITKSLISQDHTSEGILVTLNEGKIEHYFRLDPGLEGCHVGNNSKIVKRFSIDNGDNWSSPITISYNFHRRFYKENQKEGSKFFQFSINFKEI